MLTEPQGKERTETITESQTRHHTKDANVVEGPHAVDERFAAENTVHKAAEPCDADADGKDNHRADGYFLSGRPGEFEVVLPQGKVCADAHNEHEEREHQVGRSEAIPFGMAEWGIDMAPRTGVVHHNHTCYGDTAENIESEKSFLLCHFYELEVKFLRTVHWSTR